MTILRAALTRLFGPLSSAWRCGVRSMMIVSIPR